ncbi:MAG: BamA/TamA family outer membrane protein [Bacteroidales bacterium]|nr:BamA/TamA family outer membrane protein [Bacteroidales bacterium]
MSWKSFAGICSIILVILLAGCSVTKNFSPNEYLLINNKIKVNPRSVLPEDLEPYLQQHPNKKLFGLFRTNIAFYNLGSQGKETKFKKWLRNKVGAAPVLLDTGMVSVTQKQMALYLANKGYFNSKVIDSIRYNNKKATVEYYIQVAKPYLVRNIQYSIPDTQVATFVYKDTAKCLIKRGKNYDAYLFDNERSRVTGNLQNYGFYNFSNIYIAYRIDSNFRKNRMDITLEITNPVIPSLNNFNMVLQAPHKRYFIHKIYVYPEFDHLLTDTSRYDTLVKTYENAIKGQPPSTFYFLYRDKFKVKPRTIAQSVFLVPGTAYNLDDVKQTYSQLSGLQVFRYINLHFDETLEPSPIRGPCKDILDCHVELSRSAAQSFTVTADGTNSGGAFGVQGNIGYQNRNIFKGAQLLRVNLSGSLQMQASGGTSGSAFFNTVELGVNASLTFPQFLLPVKPEKMSKYFKPKTTITLGYNFQRQIDYDRHISNISFGYTWMQNEKIKHVLNPAEISLVKVFTDAYFDSVINSQTDRRLRNQYTDHMVAGLKYIFTFSNQKVNTVKDFFYIRCNFETGGNLIYGIDKLFNIPKSDSGMYNLLGLPYSQYVRPDIDFRYYNILGNKFSMVYRFYGGIGIPYCNSTELPFEKAFFAGGANGMRGWKMYYLGPGSYHSDDENTFNQIGDIQLEANIEYRFPIYQWIRGALFADMGNIWLSKETSDLPGGKFTFPGFINQIGIDAGIGIRFDFDFFIFRFDPAIPLRVPWYPENDRWYFNKMQLKDIIWNFGIGYPF